MVRPLALLVAFSVAFSVALSVTMLESAVLDEDAMGSVTLMVVEVMVSSWCRWGLMEKDVYGRVEFE
jgi:predicted anti-sigma-YlaC factor YlaD